MSANRPTLHLFCGKIAAGKSTLAARLAALLNAGVSVVLDFQANTVESRRWMRGILDETGAEHLCHVLTPPDDVCLARVRHRNGSGDHPFAVTEAQFHQISAYFEPPSSEEGFNVVVHQDGETT